MSIYHSNTTCYDRESEDTRNQWCTSPGADENMDCYVPCEVERCGCAEGAKPIIINKFSTDEWECLEQYTCCKEPDGTYEAPGCYYANIDQDDHRKEDALPGWAIAVIVLGILIPHVLSIWWSCRKLAKAKKKGKHINQEWLGPTPHNAVDIVAIQPGYAERFNIQQMDPRLTKYISPSEYTTLFDTISNSLGTKIKCCANPIEDTILLFCMFVFWPIGGFVHLFVGIEQAKWMQFNIIDQHYKESPLTNLRMSIIASNLPGKGNQGSPTRIRIYLPNGDGALYNNNSNIIQPQLIASSVVVASNSNNHEFGSGDHLTTGNNSAIVTPILTSTIANNNSSSIIPTMPTQQVAKQQLLTEEIYKLKQMKDDGVIDEAEFKAAKAKLFNI